MKKVDFDNGKITQNILQTALPMLAAQVLNLLYSIVDRIYIGRISGAGTEALGAVGLCFPIIMIVSAFTNMFGLASAVPLFFPLSSEKATKRKQAKSRTQASASLS